MPITSHFYQLSISNFTSVDISATVITVHRGLVWHNTHRKKINTRHKSHILILFTKKEEKVQSSVTDF